MKRSGILALMAACAVWVSSAASAAVPEVRCSDGNDFQVILKIAAGTGLGTLSYGHGEDLTTIENLDTSFVGDVGAATKGNQVLFVVTPRGDEKVGQLIVGGKSYLLLCE